MKEFHLPHDHGNKNSLVKLQKELTKCEKFEMVSEIFKQLSDETRLRIFWILLHSEECVINLSYLLEMSSPAISHHLRSLSECGLIVSERRDKEVYYRAADTEETRLLHKTVEEIMEMSCPKEMMDPASSPEEIIFSVHEYMMEHIPDRITIPELSKKFLLNTTTMKNTFKKVYGNSIAAHLTEHRMELAEKLLSNSTQSISDIAKKVGYESQSRFTSAFRKYHGETPTNYRKKYQKI